MKIYKVLLWAALASFLPFAHASGYIQTVVAQDVVVQRLNDQIRFCPQARVDGMLCRAPGTAHGHTSWKPKNILRGGGIQDWFTPETYVQALTGYFPQEILEVSMDPRVGLIIKFR